MSKWTMTIPNTPIEDELDLIFKTHTIGGTGRIDVQSVKAALLAWRDKAVAGAQSRHITDLAWAVGILQGLGHSDVLLERHYNEAVARLTTPTKEREENNE